MSKFQIEPVAGSDNRVFIKIDKPKEQVTTGGIVIPGLFNVKDQNGIEETMEKRPNEGTVIAVSPHDRNGVKPLLSVGDYVFFGEFAGIKYTYAAEDYWVMKEFDVFGKLTEGAEKDGLSYLNNSSKNTYTY